MGNLQRFRLASSTLNSTAGIKTQLPRCRLQLAPFANRPPSKVHSVSQESPLTTSNRSHAPSERAWRRARRCSGDASAMHARRRDRSCAVQRSERQARCLAGQASSTERAASGRVEHARSGVDVDEVDQLHIHAPVGSHQQLIRPLSRRRQLSSARRPRRDQECSRLSTRRGLTLSTRAAAGPASFSPKSGPSISLVRASILHPSRARVRRCFVDSRHTRVWRARPFPSRVVLLSPGLALPSRREPRTGTLAQTRFIASRHIESRPVLVGVPCDRSLEE